MLAKNDYIKPGVLWRRFSKPNVTHRIAAVYDDEIIRLEGYRRPLAKQTLIEGWQPVDENGERLNRKSPAGNRTITDLRHRVESLENRLTSIENLLHRAAANTGNGSSAQGNLDVGQF